MPSFVWWLAIVFSLSGCGKHAANDAAAPSPGPQISADTQPRVVAGTLSQAGAFRAQIDWAQPPKPSEPAAAKVTLTDAAGAAVQSAAGLTFVPFMPTMGHGTSMRDQVIAPVAGQPGVFQVDKVFFIMGGAWVIKMSATVNGKTDAAEVAIRL